MKLILKKRLVPVLLLLLLFNCADKKKNDESKALPEANKTGNAIEDIIFILSSKGLPHKGDYNFVATGDVNGDGWPDIAAASGGWVKVNTTGLHLFLNDTAGGWIKTDTGLPGTGTYSCVRLVDIDLDGNLDLLAGHDIYARSAKEGIIVFLGDGRGRWIPGKSPYESGYVSEFIVRDINDDGFPDIAASTQEEGVKVWLGEGGGSWTNVSSGLPSKGQYTGISMGDINKDGILDIAAATYIKGGGGKGLHIFQGTKDGSWLDRSKDISAATISDGGRAAMGVSLIDFNKDGFLDIILNTINRGILAYQGNGDFEWRLFKEGLPRRGMFIMSSFYDINADGKSEFAAGTNGSGLLLLTWLGDKWKYLAKSKLPSKGMQYTPVWADVNMDGAMDIVCATIKQGIQVWISR